MLPDVKLVAKIGIVSVRRELEFVVIVTNFSPGVLGAVMLKRKVPSAPVVWEAPLPFTTAVTFIPAIVSEVVVFTIEPLIVIFLFSCVVREAETFKLIVAKTGKAK